MIDLVHAESLPIQKRTRITLAKFGSKSFDERAPAGQAGAENNQA